MMQETWPEDPRSPKVESTKQQRGMVIYGGSEDLMRHELALLKIGANRPHINIIVLNKEQDEALNEALRREIGFDDVGVKNIIHKFEEPILFQSELRESHKVSPREQRRREKYRRR